MEDLIFEIKRKLIHISSVVYILIYYLLDKYFSQRAALLTLTLILIVLAFLEFLKITAPESAIIQVTAGFLARHPEIALQSGGARIEIQPGWHYGSRYPGDPARLAVYDFLPDSLLEKVVNLEDFRAVLVFDKWAANADGRQCVFYRAMVRQGTAGANQPAAPGFIACMIDHGYTFNGPHWDFPESAIQGLYMRPAVYRAVRSLDDFQPWLQQVMSFPEEVVDRAWKRIPAAWIADEEDELERMLTTLLERRKRLPELITACREARTNPFPNWR